MSGLNPDIRNKDSATLLDKVLSECLGGERKLFDTLSMAERETIIQWMSEALLTNDPDGPIASALWEVDFIRKPVTPKEFFTSPEYLGNSLDTLYPKWLEVLCYVLAPKNQIVEFIATGAIGLGKCLSHRELCNTSEGLLKMSEVYAERPGQAQAISGPKQITQFHNEGETETRIITTKHGHTIEGRPNHRLLVLNTDTFEPEWKYMANLQQEDVVLQSPASVGGTREASWDLAELAGRAAAEGSWADTRLSVSIPRDETLYVLALITRAGLEVHSTHNDPQSLCDQIRLRIPTHLTDYFIRARSETQEIPKAIRQGNFDTWCAFLRGYFSGGGTVTNGIPCVTTVSPVLAQHVRTMLTALGMYASVTNSVTGYKDQETGEMLRGQHHYVVRVVGMRSCRAFMERIGFAQAAKQEAMHAASNTDSDHYFSFRCNPKAFVAAQPVLKKGEAAAFGLDKKNTSAGLIHRLRTQGCTLSLLQEIKNAHGGLPGALSDLAEGRYLFDTVESNAVSSAHCYDLSVENDPSYVASGFVSHNTIVTTAAMAYKVYYLSCMRNPARYYGIASHSKIVFGFYAVTKKQAHDVGYYGLRSYFQKSPYFSNNFPFNPRKEVTTVFLKQPIEIISGSTAMHALGSNLISICVDEANFFSDEKRGDKTVNLAKELYDSATSRLYSRYMRPGGTIPGLVCLPSSRNAQNSFLEQEIEKKRGNRHVFIADYSLWEMKGQHKYFLPKIHIVVGDRMSPSKVLHAPGAFALIKEFKEGRIGEEDVKNKKKTINYEDEETPRANAKVIEVPGEFLDKFLEDTDQALRDIAGVATFNVSPFFRNRESVYQCVVPGLIHPFTSQEITIDVSADDAVQDYFSLAAACTVINGKYRPKLNPNHPRYVHFDLSLSGDSCGVCMVHPSHMVSIKKEQPDGTILHQSYPFVTVDFMLRINPPPGSEIDHGKLRAFVLFLRDIYNLRYVTFDGYMSPPSIQVLRKAGIASRILSVDRGEDPYLTLRAATYERRLGYYLYKPYIDEVLDLQRDIVKKKVDHPAKGSNGKKGSKDVSDGLSGSLFSCLSDEHNYGNMLDIAPIALTQAVQKVGASRTTPGTYTITKEHAATKIPTPEVAAQAALVPKAHVLGVDRSALDQNL